MVYNVTNIVSGNETGMLTFMQGVNHTLMFDWGGNILLLGIFAVLFMAFYSNSGDANRSLMASGFLGFILSMPMVALGLVHSWAMIASIIITAIGLATSWKD